MSQDIRIPKGLNIKLKGVAEKTISETPNSEVYSISPLDFHGLTPKMVVKVGDKVQAGDILFYSKNNEWIKIASPVSGTISEIVRGEKRVILEVRITADSKTSYKDFGKNDPMQMASEAVNTQLSQAGCMPYFIQRPYDVIPNPQVAPKAIFVSGFSTVPLSSDIPYMLRGQEKDFQTGLNALTKLTTGKVHLSVSGNEVNFLNEATNVSIHKVFGKHPAGNVGVQINQIDPVNKGETVWTIAAQDVAIIGRLFNTGVYNATRIFALVGSEVSAPQYYKGVQGVNLEKLFAEKITNDNVRFIKGDVLSGIKTSKNASLGFYDQMISVIPEGNYYTFFGWMPFTQNQKFSLSRTFFSWLTPNKEYVLDTNKNGEDRAMVLTGEMEAVFPMDIYPMQLLKAILAQDIDKMEQLGIYEIAPEDFALIDYVSSSKIEAQSIVRQGLDLMIKEVG